MGQVMDNLKLMKNVRDLESPQTLLELIAGMEQHMALYQSGIQEIRTKLDEYGIPQTHTVWSTIVLGWPAREPKPIVKNPNVVHFVD